MARLHNLYWRVPFLMFGSLVVGVLLAIGHHLFYRSLDGKEASQGGYNVLGSKYTGQQVNLAAGTAFAFLVKSFLVLSVSAAFCQSFWRSINGETQREKPPTLEHIDTAYTVSTSIFALFDVRLWYRHPSLILIAALIWLMPIAAIIAPATLSVSLAQAPPNVTMQRVPTIEFSNLNFLAGMPSVLGTNRISLYFPYNGPSQEVKRIAMAVAAQNAILPVPAPSLNSSWEVVFRGPRLQCNDAPASTRLKLQQNIAEYISEGSNCNTPAAYLAWYPHLDAVSDFVHIGPYQWNSTTAPRNSTFTIPDWIFNIGMRDWNIVAQEAIFYVAVLPHMLDLKSYTLSTEPYACLLNDKNTPLGPNNVSATNPLGFIGGDITMLQCQLYNTTYRTQFTFINGTQTVDTQLPDPATDTPVPIINAVRGPGSDGINNNDTCITLTTDDAFNPACHFNSSLLPQLAYQSILQAFTSLLTGNISLEATTAASEYISGTFDYSTIRSTSLVNTRELAFLTDYALHLTSTPMDPDLQHALENSSMPAVSALTRSQGADPQTSLKDAIETMFQNLTVSLMSVNAFQPDPASSKTAPRVSVTSVEYQTVYVYAEYKLWIAYGIAALCTLLSAVLGMISVVLHGASYSDRFSTIFLAGRNAKLSVGIGEHDGNGYGPLPAYLKTATVTFAQNRSEALETKDVADATYHSVGQAEAEHRTTTK
ncbi:hypothetical protein LTR56_012604 [Elasticomyces elasticus]|nr:hypothetical protein LTR22_018479 [Elasticomyces elasticus]KAK3639244.1 hypothetical protein LTR56_012604 [Elasticomyces elasticus]KAK4912548.1 hypothetical protein LTR49_019015 [Elasticomyces elasticus]KAK5751910.1 hypothetical protein LTS12_018016 [Elasticomyces elasticus]